MANRGWGGPIIGINSMDFDTQSRVEGFLTDAQRKFEDARLSDGKSIKEIVQEMLASVDLDEKF